MTKYILHGGYVHGSNVEANVGFFDECVKDIPDNAKMLLCYFAKREGDEYLEKSKNFEERCRNSAPEKQMEFRIATEENFLEEVKESDFIYFHGGSTPQLMEKLRNYPDLVDLFSDKTVVGSSAGAYALSTYYTSHYAGEVMEGLGAVPVRLAVHLGNERMSPNEDALKKLKESHEELELCCFGDYDWKSFEF